MNGDEFERVVLDHKDRVHTYAVWMLRDLEDARDVSQESLMRLWEHRSEVRNGAAKSWLLRTAHRLCIDRLRRRTRLSLVPIDELARPPAARNPAPVHEAVSAEVRAAVGEALAALPLRDRAAVLMREFYDMPYDEIAEVLGVSLGSLKVTLHRAREKLRKALNGVGVVS